MGQKNVFTSLTPVLQVDEDDIEKPAHDERCGRWTIWTENGWLLELLSLVFGNVLLLVLCLVLNHFDQRQVPDMGASLGSIITLNTIVAIIGTAIQASLLFPIAECLGQLKWRWLSTRDRRLEDFSTFDKASRGGPTSALTLLWTTRWHSASLGAFLVLSAISISPFFQQLITVSQQQVLDDTSTLHAAVTVLTEWRESASPEDMIYVQGAEDSASVTTGMRGAIQAGLFSLGQAFVPLKPACSTGNCTFDSYKSLAVCASTANLTSLLQYSESQQLNPISNDTYVSSLFTLNQNYSLTTGSRLLGTNDSVIGAYVNATAVGPTHSIAWPGLTSALANVIFIGSSRFDNAFAMEFMYQWCIQEYNTSVQNGIPVSTIVNADATINDSTKVNGTWDFWIGSAETTGPTKYVVGLDTQVQLADHLRELFNGSITYSSGDIYASTSSMQALYEPLRSMNLSGFEQVLSNTAMSMTNYIRSYTSPATQASTLQNFPGHAWRESTIVMIRWQWVVGPAIFALLSIIFVLSTILQSQGAGYRLHAWKSSSVAVLHALDNDLRTRVGGLAEPSELRRVDDEVRIRLARSPNAQHWQIVAASDRANAVI